MEKCAREAGLDLRESAVSLVGGSRATCRWWRGRSKKSAGEQVQRAPSGRVRRTAIGLAIAADTEAGYELRERFTRQLGVWREWDDGRQIAFDPLFEKNTPLPLKEDRPLSTSAAVHTIFYATSAISAIWNAAASTRPANRRATSRAVG